MWDGPIFIKISPPHPLMTTFRLISLSVRSISLDSTIKGPCTVKCTGFGMSSYLVVDIKNKKNKIKYAEANLLRKYENYSSCSFLCFSIHEHSCLKFHNRFLCQAYFHSRNFRYKLKFPSTSHERSRLQHFFFALTLALFCAAATAID
jgi:hypothetical protein